jgi:hypothetical protein
MKSILLITISALFTLIIVNKIEKSSKLTHELILKNSVHPIYGNYNKISADRKACSPWDYCP